jgi:hypothetical protein
MERLALTGPRSTHVLTGLVCLCCGLGWQVNDQQAALGGGGAQADPLAQVAAILNNQLNALAYMDGEVDAVATRLDRALLSSVSLAAHPAAY